MVERISRKEGRLLARDEFQRAKKELKAAKVLRRENLHFKSVSSAYYAVYHAAKAVLFLKGVAPRTHEGVERMLSLYYIKTKEIEVEIGKITGRLMKLREEADYYPEAPFSPEESSDAIESAEKFVNRIKRFL